MRAFTPFYGPLDQRLRNLENWAGSQTPTTHEAGNTTVVTGGAIVAPSFEDLDDASVTDPADGDIPIYDGTYWVNSQAYVTTLPGSATRNTIQASGDFPNLILKNNAAQSVDPFQVLDSSGGVLATIGPTGTVLAPVVKGSTASGGTLTLQSTSHATKGKLLFGTSAYDEVNHRLGIGQTTPTARLHLPAGTATASTAPLKLTAGTNLTSAEAGVFEYDGTDLFFTPGSTRKTVLLAVLSGEAQGDLLYRGATAWNNLPASTAGYFLQTQGAGANPVWAALATSFAGDVTLTPGSSARNTVQPSGDFVALRLKNNIGQVQNILEHQNVSGNTQFAIAADGKLLFGSAGDTDLYRQNAGVLMTTSQFSATRAAFNNAAYTAYVTGDTQARINIRTDGNIQWGPGGATPQDVNLYRKAAGVLMTDYTQIVAGNFTVGAYFTGSFQSLVLNSDPSWVGFMVRGASAQSADLYQSQNAVGTVVSSFSAIGAGLFRPTDAVTAASTTALTLGHATSGTPAAGFGQELRLQLQSSTTANRDAAGIVTTWGTATDATRKAKVDHYVYDTAARLALSLEASGTVAMIGFLGAPAVARAAAYTQTYATATRTHNNVTSAAVSTTAAINVAPWGYATQAQADAIPVAINAVAADLLNLKQLVNSLIDDTQANGLAA